MPEAVVILAQSGRALAQAARRAGLRPYVADLFGDEDTQASAEAWRPLRGGFGGSLCRATALQAAGELAGLAGQNLVGLILGSGFESAPTLVAELARRRPLLGADAFLVEWLKDPLRLERLLLELGIPHPPLSLEAVPRPEGWLCKRVGGSGGGHIRPASRGAPPRGSYLQKRVMGRPVSVGFLADGSACEILGFTEQWTAPSRSAPFRYGGAVIPAPLDPAVAVGMAEAVRDIVRATGLRGLTSADCLVEETGWWLLEINPRPGATLDLLDRRSTPLLRRHIEACTGRFGEPESAPAKAVAQEILYARRTIRAVPDLCWAGFVADRPRPGSRIVAGAPICTVGADGMTAGMARERLRERSAAVRAILEQEGQEDDLGRTAPERERFGCAPC
ncbi:ATP-grasp domain-containing protein [Enterovirga sp. CN4-39]|uniref:ATP-grasp domain-containing protein n=1 Tax=Enterovirga sp. CN4-39 TaxID=3400910 RepID=UPI003C09C129